MDFGQLAAYSNYALTWIGFGTVLGVVALAITPGRDQGGAVATVLMGIAGTLTGCVVLQWFNRSQVAPLPISAEGFMVGAGGAIVMLIFYRVLGQFWIIEGELLSQRRRRRRFISDYDD